MSWSRSSRVVGVVVVPAPWEAGQPQLIGIAFDEEEERGIVEDGVEGPGADAVAPTFREVEEEHGEVAEEVAHQEHYPTVDVNDDAWRKEGAAAACRRRRRRRQCRHIMNIAEQCCTLHPETTAVKQGVEEGGAEDGDDLEGLRELEPEEGGEDGDGVVEEEVVQFEAAAASS